MRSIQFYKPNSKNTGGAGAFSCSLNNRTGQVESYINLIKQLSWDSTKKVGKFYDPNITDNKIAIKMSSSELGSMMDVIENLGNEFSTVHRSDSGMTSITFKPYEFKGTKGFSLGASRDGKKFGIGLTIGEAVVVREFCRASILDMMWEDKQE